MTCAVCLIGFIFAIHGLKKFGQTVLEQREVQRKKTTQAVVSLFRYFTRGGR